MEFTHNGWRYQIIALPTLHRMQIWYLIPGQTVWEVGHGKDIPADWSPQNVATAMTSFVTGHLTWEEYNELLPR